MWEEDRIDWEKELIDAINEIKNSNEIKVKLLGCLKEKDKVCLDFRIIKFIIWGSAPNPVRP